MDTIMKVFMAVTPDKYEFPIYIEDSVKELSKKAHTTENAIQSGISKNTNGKRRGLKFVKVEIDDDD